MKQFLGSWAASYLAFMASRGLLDLDFWSSLGIALLVCIAYNGLASD